MSIAVTLETARLSTGSLKSVKLPTAHGDDYWAPPVARTGDASLTSIADRLGEYNTLYQAHQARVLRLCRSLLSDPNEADDVAQEVFLKLYRQHQQSGNTIAWAPWLTRVTVNACRDRRRSGWWKWWREGHYKFEEADFPSHEPHARAEPASTDDHASRSEGVAELVDAVKAALAVRAVLTADQLA